MSRRLFIAMLGFSLALFSDAKISQAEEDHIDEAIKPHQASHCAGPRRAYRFLLGATPRKRFVEANAAENANANPHNRRSDHTSRSSNR